MDFEIYNPTNERGSCIVRTFSKLLDKDINIVKEELNEMARENNCNNYQNVEIIEKYFKENNYEKLSIKDEILVKNLKLNNGKYAVYCYDKAERYHIFPIVNNIVYDKNDTCFDLYVINIYKLKN